MSIGLYDIDLWHAQSSIPNLELMKTYNYLYKKNQKVIFMQPGDEEGRFNKIIYFKDNPKTIIPKSINPYGENKDIYGYGFYRKNNPLLPEIAQTPPSYSPYDLWTHKLRKGLNYEKMKNSSYIRVEFNDFTDYKPDSNTIYLADRDFLYLPQAEDFLQKYRNKKLIFLRGIIAKDEDTAKKFFQYRELFSSPMTIDFKFNENFFYDNCYENVMYNITKDEHETEENYYLRIIKMILWYKKNNINFPFRYYLKDEFINFLLQWGASWEAISYEKFFQNNKNALKKIYSASPKIRVLLKQNPIFVKKENLQLKDNL